MEFDETKAVDFINSRLSSAGHKTYPEDEILNIIDMIWDYYEENGLLDIDDNDDEDDQVSTDEIVDYVTRMIKKDKGAAVEIQDIPLIVTAEFDYENSLDEI